MTTVSEVSVVAAISTICTLNFDDLIDNSDIPLSIPLTARAKLLSCGESHVCIGPVRENCFVLQSESKGEILINESRKEVFVGGKPNLISYLRQNCTYKIVIFIKSHNTTIHIRTPPVIEIHRLLQVGRQIAQITFTRPIETIATHTQLPAAINRQEIAKRARDLVQQKKNSDSELELQATTIPDTNSDIEMPVIGHVIGSRMAAAACFMYKNQAQVNANAHSPNRRGDLIIGKPPRDLHPTVKAASDWKIMNSCNDPTRILVDKLCGVHSVAVPQIENSTSVPQSDVVKEVLPVLKKRLPKLEAVCQQPSNSVSVITGSQSQYATDLYEVFFESMSTRKKIFVHSTNCSVLCSGLEPATYYATRVRSRCEVTRVFSPWSERRVFTTSAGIVFSVSEVLHNSVLLEWRVGEIPESTEGNSKAILDQELTSHSSDNSCSIAIVISPADEDQLKSENTFRFTTIGLSNDELKSSHRFTELLQNTKYNGVLTCTPDELFHGVSEYKVEFCTPLKPRLRKKKQNTGGGIENSAAALAAIQSKEGGLGSRNVRYDRSLPSHFRKKQERLQPLFSSLPATPTEVPPVETLETPTFDASVVQPVVSSPLTLPTKQSPHISPTKKTDYTSLILQQSESGSPSAPIDPSEEDNQSQRHSLSSSVSDTDSSTESEPMRVVLNPVTKVFLISAEEHALTFGWRGDIPGTSSTNYRIRIFTMATGKTILPWGFCHENPNKRVTMKSIDEYPSVLPGQDVDDPRRTFESTLSSSVSQYRIPELRPNAKYGVKMCCYDPIGNHWLPWSPAEILQTLKVAELSITQIRYNSVSLKPSTQGEGRTELRIAIYDGGTAQNLRSHFEPNAEPCVEDLSGNCRYVFEARHQQENGWGSWSNKVQLAYRCVPIELSPYGEDNIEISWSQKDLAQAPVGITTKYFIVIKALSAKKVEDIELDHLPTKGRHRLTGLQQDRYRITFLQVLEITDEASWASISKYFWIEKYAAIALIKQFDVLISKIGEDSITLFAVQSSDKHRIPKPYTLESSTLEQERQFLQVIEKVRSQGEVDSMAKDILKFEIAITRLDNGQQQTRQFQPTAQLGGIVCGFVPDKPYSLRLRPQLQAGSSQYWGAWSSLTRFTTLSKLHLEADVVGEDFVHIRWSRTVPFKTASEVLEHQAIQKLLDLGTIGLDEEQKRQHEIDIESERDIWKFRKDERDKRRARRRKRRREKYPHEKDPPVDKIIKPTSAGDKADAWTAVMQELASAENRERIRANHRKQKAQKVLIQQEFTDSQLEAREQYILKKQQLQRSKTGPEALLDVVLTADEEARFSIPPNEVISSDSTDDADDHPYLQFLYKTNTDYEVWIRVEGEKDPILRRVTWDEDQFLVQGLTSGIRHAIKVRQEALATGWSLWSNHIMIQTLADIRVKIHEVGEEYVNLSCSRAPVEVGDEGACEDTQVITLQDDVGSVTGYQVRITFRSSRGYTTTQQGFQVIRDISLDKFHDIFLVGGLQTDSLYSICVRVKVRNEYWGQWSELVSFRTARPIGLTITSVSESSIEISWMRPPLDTVEPRQPILALNSEGEYEAVYQTQIAVCHAILYWTITIQGMLPNSDMTSDDKWVTGNQIIEEPFQKSSKEITRLQPDSVYRLTVRSIDSVGIISPYSPPYYVVTKPSVTSKIIILGEHFGVLKSERAVRCTEVANLKIVAERFLKLTEQRLAAQQPTEGKKSKKIGKKVRHQKQESSSASIPTLTDSKNKSPEELLYEEGASVLIEDGKDLGFEVRVIPSEVWEESQKKPIIGEKCRFTIIPPEASNKIAITRTDSTDVRILQNLEPGSTYACVSRALHQWSSKQKSSKQDSSEHAEWGAWCEPAFIETLPALEVILVNVYEYSIEFTISKGNHCPTSLYNFTGTTSFLYQCAINENTSLEPLCLKSDGPTSFKIVGLERDKQYNVTMRNKIYDVNAGINGTVCFDSWHSIFHFRTLPRRPCMPVLYEARPLPTGGLVVGFFWRTERDADCISGLELKSTDVSIYKQGVSMAMLRARFIELYGVAYTTTEISPSGIWDVDGDEEDDDDIRPSRGFKQQTSQIDLASGNSIADTLRIYLTFSADALRKLIAQSQGRHHDLPTGIPPTELALRLSHIIMCNKSNQSHYSVVNYKLLRGLHRSYVRPFPIVTHKLQRIPDVSPSSSRAEQLLQNLPGSSFVPLLRKMKSDLCYLSDTPEVQPDGIDPSGLDMPSVTNLCTVIIYENVSGMTFEGSVESLFGPPLKVRTPPPEKTTSTTQTLTKAEDYLKGLLSCDSSAYLVQAASIISLDNGDSNAWHVVGEVVGAGFIRVILEKGRLSDYTFRLRGRSECADKLFNFYSNRLKERKLWSSYSVAVSWKEKQPPKVCTNLQSSHITHSSAIIKWVPPENRSCHNQLTYSIFIMRVGDDSKWVETVRVLTPICHLTNLAIRSTYKVAVRTCSTFGSSSLSKVIRFCTSIRAVENKLLKLSQLESLKQVTWYSGDWKWPYPSPTESDYVSPFSSSCFHLPVNMEVGSATKRKLYSQQLNSTHKTPACLVVPDNKDVLPPVCIPKEGHSNTSLDGGMISIDKLEHKNTISQSGLKQSFLTESNQIKLRKQSFRRARRRRRGSLLETERRRKFKIDELEELEDLSDDRDLHSYNPPEADIVLISCLKIQSPVPPSPISEASGLPKQIEPELSPRKCVVFNIENKDSELHIQKQESNASSSGFADSQLFVVESELESLNLVQTEADDLFAESVKKLQVSKLSSKNVVDTESNSGGLQGALTLSALYQVTPAATAIPSTWDVQGDDVKDVSPQDYLPHDVVSNIPEKVRRVRPRPPPKSLITTSFRRRGRVTFHTRRTILNTKTIPKNWFVSSEVEDILEGPISTLPLYNAFSEEINPA